MAKADAVSKKTMGLTETLASKFNMDWESFLNTFKATVFKSCDKVPSNEEVAMMMLVCKQYELNPFVGQVFAFKAKNGAIVPVVGIDGFTTIAERSKDYNGFEMTFSENNVLIEPIAKPCPEWCEVKVYRRNQDHPTVVREYLDEVYVAPRGEKKWAGAWQSHTKRMLRHKTLIQAFRLTFAITGIYDEDEAHRIDAAVSEVKTKPGFIPAQEVKMIDAPAVVPVDAPPTKEPEKPKVDPKDLATSEQLSQILDLVNSLKDPMAASNGICADYKVQTNAELSKVQADEVTKALIALYKTEQKAKK